MALGFGLLAWMALLFSPLAFVQTAQAQDTESYGTVIGIVSCTSQASLATIAAFVGPSLSPTDLNKFDVMSNF